MLRWVRTSVSDASRRGTGPRWRRKAQSLKGTRAQTSCVCVCVRARARERARERVRGYLRHVLEQYWVPCQESVTEQPVPARAPLHIFGLAFVLRDGRRGLGHPARARAGSGPHSVEKRHRRPREPSRELIRSAADATAATVFAPRICPDAALVLWSAK